MTKAIEQQLTSIVSMPWSCLQQSFRNFLQRRPVSSTPIEESQAGDIVSNLQDDYLIIQGPPGTGKTQLDLSLWVWWNSKVCTDKDMLSLCP